MGFTPDLVAGIWIGHYEFRSLGNRQYGGLVAGPIFLQFLNSVLAERPDLCVNFRTPKGLIFSSLNPLTGLPYNEIEGEALPEPELFKADQDIGCAYRDTGGFCTTRETVTVTVEVDDEGNVIDKVVVGEGEVH